MSTRSRQAYETALKVAPNDPEANAALGLVQLNGKWVTQEESYEARGYVKYNGEWMTSAQAQVEQKQDANDQARRDAEQRASDAEAAARAADARAGKAEADAKAAQQALQTQQTYYDPVLYGGWGYGVTTWPTAGAPGRPNTVPPPRTPGRVPR